MNKTLVVAKWEFMNQFKWKQELGSYLFLLIIYIAIFAVQMWNEASRQKQFQLGTVGNIQASLDDSFRLSKVPDDVIGDSALFEFIDAQQLDGILHGQDNQYQLYVAQQASWQQMLQRQLSDFHRNALIEQLNLNQAELTLLEQPIAFETLNKTHKELGNASYYLSLGAVILASIGVFMSFAYCFQSVTTEKQQRVTEQMLTCISHQQWIDGKTLGICLSSVKSIVSTGLYMGVAVLGFTLFDDTTDAWSLDLPLLTSIQLLIFIACGVIFWNYFFVGFASVIDDPNHSGKSGIMMLPMLPVFLVFMLMDDPASQVAVVLSIFPLTSISFMPMRLVSMQVPVWEIALSIVCLAMAIYLMRVGASRVFRANVTLYGKEPGWGEIGRSMFKSA